MYAMTDLQGMQALQLQTRIPPQHMGGFEDELLKLSADLLPSFDQDKNITICAGSRI